MSTKNSFSTREAARLSGFRTAHMVAYLTKTGVVEPSIRARPGKGLKRLYSFSDVVLLRALNRLLQQGIPVRKLKMAQRKYRELHDASEAGQVPARYLMTDGIRVFYTEDPSRVVDLTDNGQLAFAFVLDMEPINREVVDLAQSISA